MRACEVGTRMVHKSASQFPLSYKSGIVAWRSQVICIHKHPCNTHHKHSATVPATEFPDCSCRLEFVSKIFIPGCTEQLERSNTEQSKELDLLQTLLQRIVRPSDHWELRIVENVRKLFRNVKNYPAFGIAAPSLNLATSLPPHFCSWGARRDWDVAEQKPRIPTRLS